MSSVNNRPSQCSRRCTKETELIWCQIFTRVVRGRANFLFSVFFFSEENVTIVIVSRGDWVSNSHN